MYCKECGKETLFPVGDDFCSIVCQEYHYYEDEYDYAEEYSEAPYSYPDAYDDIGGW